MSQRDNFIRFDYATDKEWEETHHAQVKSILAPLMHLLAKLDVASIEKDRSYATDFELKLLGGTIAVRLRRWDCTFRDFTIRSYRTNGTETELSKLKKGYAYRYFYGWTNKQGEIAEWILVDLDKVRRAGLLEKQRRPRPNKDGETFFIAIALKELFDEECILASQLKSQQAANTTRTVVSTEQTKRGFNYFKKQTQTVEETYTWHDSDEDLFALENGIAEADRIWDEREGW